MRGALHYAARFGCAGLVAISLGADAWADDASRLPRPRPEVAPQAPPSMATVSESRAPRPRPDGTSEPDATEWTARLQSRFSAAEAELKTVVPVVEERVPPVVTTADVEPADAVSPSAASTALNGFVAIERLARLPRARPGPTPLLALASPGNPADPPDAPAAPRVVGPEDQACLNRLAALGVAFTKQPPIDDGACFVPHPLTISALGSGVAIVPHTTLNCSATEALARWTKDVLVPAARELIGATPTKVVHGSTYVCRPRNNQPDAKLSEHASANAVDISSIAFAEREPLQISDRDQASPEGRFQLAIRAGSCEHFTTVLGPRSDASHASHFHFDLAERRGGYRLCEVLAGGEEP